MLDKFSQETAYEKRMVNQQGADYLTPEQRQMNVWQYYNGGYYWVWRAGQWIKNPVLIQKQYIKCTINGVGFPYADCVNNIAEQHPNDWCK